MKDEPLGMELTLEGVEESFGPHLTLDMKGCPKEILQNYDS